MTSETAVDLRHYIRKVADGDLLSAEEAEQAMDGIMRGEATSAQIAALVTALRVRGETVDEIAGFARAMRRHALAVSPPDNAPVVDTCGTGGDDAGTFNISTTAAFVIAGAGAIVAKHGNRAVTSQCGSADLLEALGVRIELTPDQVATCLQEANIGFMFAPVFHPSFRHAGPTRREIGIRTVFNILGPLTNPAGVRRQLIGVGNAAIARKLAEAHGALGSDRVVVVHSEDGLDEISVSGPTEVTEYDAGDIRRYTVTPEDAGLMRHPKEAVLGGSVDQNAQITRAVLEGVEGAPRDVVALNAAAGLYAAGLAGDLLEGVAMAQRSIDSGAALAAVERLVAVSNRWSAA